MRMKQSLCKIVLLLILLSFCSCSHFAHHPPRVIETPSFMQWAASSPLPRTIAILPFSNDTNVQGINELMRKSFYEYFSVKPFYDVEMEEIDEAIKSVLEKSEGKDIYALPSAELGKQLKCDALVYGRVITLKKMFLLLYSQLLLEAEVKIVDARSGKELWKHTLTKKFREGDIPTGPVGVVLITMKAGSKLRKSRMNKDIDAFCREFVSIIPEVRPTLASKSEEPCEIQVASFKLKEGALTTSSQLSQQGYKSFVREVPRNGEILYRVMVGPFASRKEAARSHEKLKREFDFLTPLVVREAASNSSAIRKGVEERYDLKVASFKLEEGAHLISSKLSQHGYKPFLKIENTNGALWYNVMLGPYASKEEAVHHQVQLQEEFRFLNPIIVSSEKEFMKN